MSRDFFINGESLVLVRGRSDSAIGSLTQLGLSSDPIRITPEFRHLDIPVDAWGTMGVPADVQWMLGTCSISFSLIHYDQAVLDTCLALSMGGGQTAPGQMARAGTRLGNNLPRFTPGNNYISLNISSPIAGKPYRFFFCYLQSPPVTIPLGTEKSIVATNWRAVPFTQDPANIVNGTILGATNYPLWDNTLDT